MTGTLAWLQRQGDRLLREAARVLADHPPQTDPNAASNPSPVLMPIPVPMPGPIADRAPDFAPNPGHLQMHSHIPHGLPAGAPLVVLLHGCGQDPEDFATRSGWRYLAAKHHFALLMPGQTEANNPQRCFNWFRPGDVLRDHGEAASVVSMVQSMIRTTHCDPERIFVTGLSAGGAMAASLLAAYPDLFAGGAVVAGLPAASANNVVSAMARMAGRGGEHTAAEWADQARRLGGVPGERGWPRVSVWHGLADTVVTARNGIDVAQQFATLHGLGPGVPMPHAAGAARMVWGETESPTVELWQLASAGHVYPTINGEGISAAHEIARFWGLAEG